MGDKEDAPGEVRQVVLQQADRIEVQIVRRLVQKQEVGSRGQEPHEREPAQLSTGEPIQRDGMHGAGKEKPLQELFGGERATALLRNTLA